MKSEDFQILIGNRIQELRRAKGLTQVDLVGKMAGNIDTTNISRIEKGRINTSAYMLYRIAIALEMSLKDLVDIEYQTN
jgi:transcriptional regulator with XRE-family HTH domain